MALQIRRGTNAERQLITPLVGELIYTTDTKKVYIGDGATLGGVQITSGIAGGGDTELVTDLSPQLGGALDLNSQNIIGTGNINIDGNIDTTGNINIGGTITASGFIGPITLEVLSNGVISFENDVVSTTTSQIVIGTGLEQQGNVLVLNTVNGNPVRINGRSNPSFFPVAKMEFNAIGGTFSTPVQPSSGDYIGGLSFITTVPSTNDKIPAGLIVMQLDPTETVNSGTAKGKLTFLTNGGTSANPNPKLMTFDAKGRLAINQEYAQATLDVNGIMKLAKQSSAPVPAIEGMIAVADGTAWDPANKGTGASYPAYYDGSVWRALF